MAMAMSVALRDEACSKRHVYEAKFTRPTLNSSHLEINHINTLYVSQIFLSFEEDGPIRNVLPREVDGGFESYMHRLSDTARFRLEFSLPISTILDFPIPYRFSNFDTGGVSFRRHRYQISTGGE